MAEHIERTTLSGRLPETLDHAAPGPADPVTGLRRDYWILSDAERGLGFVRPVRLAYRHNSCGRVTTMNRKIAETYARDPAFYSHTYCATCLGHHPVAEFVWDGTDQVVGS